MLKYLHASEKEIINAPNLFLFHVYCRLVGFIDDEIKSFYLLFSVVKRPLNKFLAKNVVNLFVLIKRTRIFSTKKFTLVLLVEQ